MLGAEQLTNFTLPVLGIQIVWTAQRDMSRKTVRGWSKGVNACSKLTTTLPLEQYFA